MIGGQIDMAQASRSGERAGAGGAGPFSPDDDLLVARVLAGDRAAFAGIVERHHPPVRRLAYRMLGDPDDADDATQEAFVRAYVNLTKYRPGSSMRTWLLAITGNWCLDQLRRRKLRRRRMVQLDTVAESLEARDGTPETRLLRAEACSALRDRLATMPEHYRLILALRYDHELSYDEIGAVLASPVSTVRMRLFRARRHLARGTAPDAMPLTFAEGAD